MRERFFDEHLIFYSPIIIDWSFQTTKELKINKQILPWTHDFVFKIDAYTFETILSCLLHHILVFIVECSANGDDNADESTNKTYSNLFQMNYFKGHSDSTQIELNLIIHRDMWSKN